MLVRRTESEIKAYIDGYNACYKQFVKMLDKSVVSNQNTVEIMYKFVTAVNNTIKKENE